MWKPEELEVLVALDHLVEVGHDLVDGHRLLPRVQDERGLALQGHRCQHAESPEPHPRRAEEIWSFGEVLSSLPFSVPSAFLVGSASK